MRNERLCTVEDCGAQYIARGWCVKHYQRWKKYGDPVYPVKFKANTIVEAFDHYTEVSGDCLIWTGHTRGGYGRVRHNGPYKTAHRVAWEIANGPIADGLEVDHTCFNRSCVNVAHLRLTTHKQNQEHSSGAMSNSKSGVRGVYWDIKSHKWRGEVGHNKKIVFVGLFESLSDAAEAVREVRNRLHTHNDKDRACLTA